MEEEFKLEFPEEKKEEKKEEEEEEEDLFGDDDDEDDEAAEAMQEKLPTGVIATERGGEAAR